MKACGEAAIHKISFQFCDSQILIRVILIYDGQIELHKILQIQFLKLRMLCLALGISEIN